MGHATFAPSGLNRVALCPGSWALTKDMPREDSPEAARGTRLHALLADRVAAHLGREQTAFLEGYSESDLPTQDRNELNRAAEWALSHPAMTGGAGCSVWIEEKLEIGRWCGLDEGLLWGTSDLICVTRDCLEVIDAKFGRVPVDPNSWQLKAYAVGAGRLLADPGIGGFRPEHRQVRSVKLTILQPSQPLLSNSQTYMVDTLLDWAKDIREIVQKAQAERPALVSGAQCRWCAGKTICKAYGEAVAGAAKAIKNAPPPPAADTMFLPVDPPPPAITLDPFGDNRPPGPDPIRPASSGGFLRETVETLLSLNSDNPSLEEQALILKHAPIILQYIKALVLKAETGIKEELKAGHPVAGWKLVEGRRSRKWNLPDKDIVAALSKIGVPAAVCWDKKLRSVSQIEKEVPENKTERFAVLYSWGEGAPTLAEDTDPRPPVREPAAMFEPATEVFSWL